MMTRKVHQLSLLGQLMISFNNGLSARGHSTRINSDSMLYFSSSSNKLLRDTCMRGSILRRGRHSGREQLNSNMVVSQMLLYPFFKNSYLLRHLQQYRHH